MTHPVRWKIGGGVVSVYDGVARRPKSKESAPGQEYRKNGRLHLLKNLDPSREAEYVPLAVEVDAIWITLLRPNGEVRRDHEGRKRPVKGLCSALQMVWFDAEQQRYCGGRCHGSPPSRG